MSGFLQDFWFSITRPRRGRPKLELDSSTLQTVAVLAEQENRAPDEVAAELLQAGLRDRQETVMAQLLWQCLTPREQDVTALICQNLTTRQIAARLYLSPDTVKTHARHILDKFNVPNREALRQMLSGWDFSAWA
ncbi:MAG TPA: LuxR C-terminal-related transcriptional regulator [Anaerolineaceae bacterium]|nr:LuxR C-terminal-related transcriptional regulator [Anaerolineaceae bacterium]HPN52290.1 LuxR C-terminal-related transcriptional regulator [Anaerolineaceae bacterium]